MTYNGKTVIRMVGRLSGRGRGGSAILEYEDHTTQEIFLLPCRKEKANASSGAKIKAEEWKLFGGSAAVGFGIGVALAAWVKYTLVAQGVYQSLF